MLHAVTFNYITNISEQVFKQQITLSDFVKCLNSNCSHIESLKFTTSRVNKLRYYKLNDNKEEADKIKRLLPSIIFGADNNTKERKAAKWNEQFIIIDIDHISFDRNILNETRDKILNKFSETVLIFNSPSGDGLKVLLYVNVDDITFENVDIFNYYKREFENLGLEIDKGCKDLGTRLCFFSIDNDCYVNYDAKAKKFTNDDIIKVITETKKERNIKEKTALDIVFTEMNVNTNLNEYLTEQLTNNKQRHTTLFNFVTRCNHKGISIDEVIACLVNVLPKFKKIDDGNDWISQKILMASDVYNRYKEQFNQFNETNNAIFDIDKHKINVNQYITLDNIKSIMSTNSKYCALKANTGMGKSTVLHEYIINDFIQTENKCAITVIPYRNILDENLNLASENVVICKEGFRNSDIIDSIISKMKAGKSYYFITTIDQLDSIAHILMHARRECDLMIIDEAHTLSESTNYKVDIIERIDLIRAHKTIYTTATFTQSFLQFIDNYRIEMFEFVTDNVDKYDIKYVSFKNDYDLNNKLVKQIETSLSNNRKIMLDFNDKNEQKIISDILIKRNICTEIDILNINKDNLINEYLENGILINEKKVIMSTTSGRVGYSILNNEQFDILLVDLNNNKLKDSDIIQFTNRTRNARNRNVYLFNNNMKNKRGKSTNLAYYLDKKKESKREKNSSLAKKTVDITNCWVAINLADQDYYKKLSVFELIDLVCKNDTRFNYRGEHIIESTNEELAEVKLIRDNYFKNQEKTENITKQVNKIEVLSDSLIYILKEKYNARFNEVDYKALKESLINQNVTRAKAIKLLNDYIKILKDSIIDEHLLKLIENNGGIKNLLHYAKYPQLVKALNLLKSVGYTHEQAYEKINRFGKNNKTVDIFEDYYINKEQSDYYNCINEVITYFKNNYNNKVNMIQSCDIFNILAEIVKKHEYNITVNKKTVKYIMQMIYKNVKIKRKTNTIVYITSDFINNFSDLASIFNVNKDNESNNNTQAITESMSNIIDTKYNQINEDIDRMIDEFNNTDCINDDTLVYLMC